MGIGRAFSELLASFGFNIFIVSNDDQANHDTRRFLQEEFAAVQTNSLYLDLAQEDFKEELKRIPDYDFRMLINCAGIPTRRSPPANAGNFRQNERRYDFELVSFEEIRNCFQINCIALTLFTNFFLQRRKALSAKVPKSEQQSRQQQHSGTIQPSAIVNMSSMTSKTLTYHLGIYGSGKFFVDHLSGSLLEELKSQRVHVISATPGLVRTRLTGFGNSFAFIDPDECVKGILKDLSLLKDHSFSHWKHQLFYVVHQLVATFSQKYADYMVMWDLIKPKRDQFDYS